LETYKQQSFWERVAMKFNFFDKFGIAGFTPEESSFTAEFLHNSDADSGSDGFIDWSYWADVNITPIDAAYLIHAVDVDIRDDANTPLPRQKMQDGLQKDIDKLARWLSSKSPSWSLKQLVDTFGAENLSTRLVAAVKAVDDATPALDTRTKLEKQHDAILSVIKQKGFDPMKIPCGEKGTIEDICRADYPEIFDGSSSFGNAWREGRGKIFRMANHASYSKRK
jgi:hypothetical protein